MPFIQQGHPFWYWMVDFVLWRIELRTINRLYKWFISIFVTTVSSWWSSLLLFFIESLNQYDDLLSGIYIYIYTREGLQQVFTANYNCFVTLDLVATSLFILISEERRQNWPIYYRYFPLKITLLLYTYTAVRIICFIKYFVFTWAFSSLLLPISI